MISAIPAGAGVLHFLGSQSSIIHRRGELQKMQGDHWKSEHWIHFLFLCIFSSQESNPSSITLIIVHRVSIYSLPNMIWWVWILIYVLSMPRCYIFLTIIWALLFIIGPQWRSSCNELWCTDIFHVCWLCQIYCNYSWKGWSNLLKSHCGNRNFCRRFSLNFLWSSAKIFCSKSLNDCQPA